MSTDQATELRKLVGASRRKVEAPAPAPHDAPRGARVIAITSGKGGVGKSNIAVNLATKLANMNRRVVLLDADLGMANADVLAGVNAKANLAHVVAGRRQLKEAVCKTPGGFYLVPGASGLAQMANLSEFERARVIDLLRRLDAQADLILIDTGAGLSPNVLSFALAADEVLVVTTPEPTAVTDAYGMIKTINRRKEGAEVNLLVNMVRDRHEARRVYERISAVCRRFLGLSLRDAGYVLHDAKVAQAVRSRRPFVLSDPDSPASVCVTQLAHKIDRHASAPRATGFVRRMANWLAG